MPISEHPSFNRPTISTRLWRYTDLPKFVELLTSRRLWLTNAEVLASDDPYEGLPWALQFPHRIWRTLDDVPEGMRSRIIQSFGRGQETSPEEAFRCWFKHEEQFCIMNRYGRRNFYVNCWHAADHQSVAMWKIYGAPGAGVAIVTNGGRLETALALNDEDLHLGEVRYVDSAQVEIGTPNVFDTLMVKRSSYRYEQEVRLVHWAPSEHDPLAKFAWNDETMRFEDLIEDPVPLTPGISLECDLDVLIEAVIVSPFAPPWYAATIERLRDQLKCRFPVYASDLVAAPPVVP